MAGSNNWEVQLMMLRTLTAASDSIHDAQRFQLLQWGAIAFGAGKDTWECHVEVSSHKVVYKLSTLSGIAGKSWRAAGPYVKALERSIHWLLGDEWALDIFHNKKSLFTGRRLVDKGKKTNEQRRTRVDG